MTAGAPSGGVVVDTSVFGAGLTPPTKHLAERYRAVLAGKPVVISFQTAAEIRYGALRGAWGRRRLDRVDGLLAEATTVFPNGELVLEYAQLRHECTQAGHALGQKHHEADRWIAATARWLRVPLLAHDAVFRGAPGLEVLTELA